MFGSSKYFWKGIDGSLIFQQATAILEFNVVCRAIMQQIESEPWESILPLREVPILIFALSARKKVEFLGEDSSLVILRHRWEAGTAISMPPPTFAVYELVSRSIAYYEIAFKVWQECFWVPL